VCNWGNLIVVLSCGVDWVDLFALRMCVGARV
jgi:hypothetical protein